MEFLLWETSEVIRNEMFTYDEDFMGHIVLYSPDGESIYLQVDTDIECFRKAIESIDAQWFLNNRKGYHPIEFKIIEEEYSYMISNYFGN